MPIPQQLNDVSLEECGVPLDGCLWVLGKLLDLSDVGDGLEMASPTVLVLALLGAELAKVLQSLGSPEFVVAKHYNVNMS